MVGARALTPNKHKVRGERQRGVQRSQLDADAPADEPPAPHDQPDRQRRGQQHQRRDAQRAARIRKTCPEEPASPWISERPTRTSHTTAVTAHAQAHSPDPDTVNPMIASPKTADTAHLVMIAASPPQRPRDHPARRDLGCAI